MTSGDLEEGIAEHLAERGLLSRMYIIPTSQVEKIYNPKEKAAKDMS